MKRNRRLSFVGVLGNNNRGSYYKGPLRKENRIKDFKDTFQIMGRFISCINRNIDTEIVGIEYNYGELKINLFWSYHRNKGAKKHLGIKLINI
jgi:hypothetical protein|tara:strand:- start:39 stop:317 length:279 start_codon:yes stop_codon:yes gene_type:complete